MSESLCLVQFIIFATSVCIEILLTDDRETQRHRTNREPEDKNKIK